MKDLPGVEKEKALKKFRRELRAGLYSYLILSILEKKGELHGYAIRKELEDLSSGELVPSEGALYDILKSLKKLGLVENFWAEIGGRPRKYYRLTPLGQEVIREVRAEIEEIKRTLERLEDPRAASNI
ncbi:transcriptional regulator, PadR family protein [Pyrococcus yayanosii CH1]|uniref:Transcriptional regulator, PadR family protein n=1 Tax=Pyrococcus yayanosii (strain CH1 / JCM 16557) TaxID=529709 RepID=F8AEJ7_PYRYC|nr:transcriptional regulator, PadR family protein [Pyrococcus yayanosii CH1]